MSHSVARNYAVALALLAPIAVTLDAQAQSVEQFYKGKQISMLINSGAGGGYDLYARTFARHFPKHIPGNPGIIPKNLPGAGGLVAANTLYNNSDPDGLTIGALANTTGLDPLTGSTVAKYDGQKFNWLGSIGKVSSVCLTWHESPIKTVQQVREKEVIVAGATPGTNSVVVPYIVNSMLGTKFKVISGYEAGRGMELAVERKEVDGICGLSWSTLKAARPDWISGKRLNVILQMSMVKLADLPDVPSVLDLVTNADDKKALEFILIRQETGRPFATTPGVPADRVAALRAAFDATMKDTEFLAETEKLQLEVDPLTGAQIDDLLKQAYGTSKDIVAKASDILTKASAAK
jgi:tripartite-type tricarboxylate transporter receptor subunit TctC